VEGQLAQERELRGLAEEGLAQALLKLEENRRLMNHTEVRRGGSFHSTVNKGMYRMRGFSSEIRRLRLFSSTPRG
jgi:hypothetical protein